MCTLKTCHESLVEERRESVRDSKVREELEGEVKLLGLESKFGWGVSEMNPEVQELLSRLQVENDSLKALRHFTSEEHVFDLESKVTDVEMIKEAFESKYRTAVGDHNSLKETLSTLQEDLNTTSANNARLSSLNVTLTSDLLVSNQK